MAGGRLSTAGKITPRLSTDVGTAKPPRYLYKTMQEQIPPVSKIEARP